MLTTSMVLNLLINGCHVVRCNKYNYLGITLDECLTLKPHFNTILKKFTYKVFQFGKLTHFLNIKYRILIYKQTVLPLLEYVSCILYLCNKHELDKLQKVQNRALRHIFSIKHNQDISVDELHCQASIDTLCQCRKLHLLTLMFQLYGSNDFRAVSTRDTRLSRKYTFELTRARVDLYSRSPYVVGARIWNLLPLDVQSCSSLTVFKARVSDYLKELVA